VSEEDQATDRLLREAGPKADGIAAHLGPADPGARTRALTKLHATRGNTFVQDVVRAMDGGRAGHATGHGLAAGAATTRTTTLVLERGAAEASSRVDVQRDEGEDAEALGTSTGAVTETIGPSVESSWSIAASSLADAAAVISGRDEAGHVGWSLDMKYTATKGPIDSVTLTASITLEMPEWTPPPSMLPKAKAEWARWYAALRAHEQGHIDLVHANLDGLAARLIGMSGAKGEATFGAAKAKLSKDNKAYDKRTDHGRNAGTVMDVSIEQRELDEARRLEEEKKKKQQGAAPEGREGRTPAVPDEAGD
jgi:predicted secreted Zn-dependent protease